MTAQSFAFTKLVVADLAAAERFYIQTLGLSRLTYIEWGEGPGQLEEVVLVVPNGGPGSPQLNLIRYPNKPMPAPGETVIGFMVSDVEAIVAAFIEAGGRITVPVVEMSEHRLKLAYATDLDGHIIEVLQAL
ncbi:VOC family protein [Novosphingobium sp. Chol11]|uniref:VOC family protein n=1 Tax=Novosphingobium sp. Chol11 TaxID=1385763 RepID=UPI000BE3827C|nr:VOC family protein [Novosphingobium sp. Chol11]